MDLGLYREPIINFQVSKSKERSRWMYVRILIWNKKCWKIQLQWQLLHIYHPIFRPTFNCFLSTLQISFTPEKLCTHHVLNNNSHSNVLFRPSDFSEYMKTFKVFLFFTKFYFKMSSEYYNAYKFQFMRSRFEGNFIQTFLIQSEMYSFF